MSSAARQRARHPERHQPAPSYGEKVCIAYIHPGHVDGQFCASVVGLVLADAHDRHVVNGHINIESGPRIVEARSQVVEAFLSAPELESCGWLLMIDADMTFEADALYRLLDSAEEVGAAAIGGLCFAGGHSDRVYPTIYRLTNEADGHPGVEPVTEYPEGVVKVGATGAAFLLVRRRLLMEMTIAFGHGPDGTANPYPWFVEAVGPGGRPFGEDVAFCMRANALGAGVYVDTTVKIGHMKRRVLDEAAFAASRALVP